MRLKFKVLGEFKLVDGTTIDLTPTKGTADAVGFDLRAAEAIVIPAVSHKTVSCARCGAAVVVHVPGRAVVRTGLAFEIPLGYEGQVRPRSGLARKNGLSIPNTPCTVDPDYRGEVTVTMINFGGEDFHVCAGDRFCQLVIAETVPVTMEQSVSLGDTVRGEQGFGSTGVK